SWIFDYFQLPEDKKLQYAYAFLEISPDASDQEVARAYREKARQVHPDKGGSDEEFKILAVHVEVIKAHRARTASADSPKSAEAQGCSAPALSLAQVFL
ncbi:unnamed protein product, partial [Symbiodinium necroappetens]